MDIRAEQGEGCTVVSLAGRLDAATAARLGAYFDHLAHCTQGEIILEMEDVDFIGVAAVSSIIRLHKSMKEKGGSVILHNVASEIYRVFESSYLDRVLNIFEARNRHAA